MRSRAIKSQIEDTSNVRRNSAEFFLKLLYLSSSLPVGSTQLKRREKCIKENVTKLLKNKCTNNKNKKQN